MFQSGGIVRQDSFYVERPADEALFQALRHGEFRYVLAPRQTGKSSLRVHTAQRLHAEGIRCVTIDLTGISRHETTEDDWYFEIIEKLADQLELDDPLEFWQQHASRQPFNRWMTYLRAEVLAKVFQPIVIFIDEIDAMLSLPFSDDFLAGIRAIENNRETDADYKRLTFCLLGVTRPTDLIKDATITAFSVGRGIPIDDFTFPQIKATLLPGLDGLGGDARRLLQAVFDWTSGHPYMTQRICEELVAQREQTRVNEAERVENVVRKVFLRGGLEESPLLADAQNRLLCNEKAGELLQIYGRLTQDERIPTDGNPIHQALRLTGMVAERQEVDGTFLKIRNRIFATIFNESWVRKQEAARDRRLAQPVRDWLASSENQSYLLRGAALAEALEWATGREDVSQEERKFLLDSQQNATHEEEQRARIQTQLAQTRRRWLVGWITATGLMVALLLDIGFRIPEAIKVRNLTRDKIRLTKQIKLEQNQFNANKADFANQIEQQKAELKKTTNKLKQAQAKEHLAVLHAQASDKNAKQASRQEQRTKLRTGLILQAADKKLADARHETKLEQRAGESVKFAYEARRALTEHRDRGLLLASLALDRFDTPDARGALLDTLNACLYAQQFLYTNSSLNSLPVLELAFTDNGNHLIAQCEDGRLHRWQKHGDRYEPISSLPTANLRFAIFSPTQPVIAGIEEFGGKVRRWDSMTGKEQPLLQSPPEEEATDNRVDRIVYSRDGLQLAGATRDGRMCTWDAHTGRMTSIHGVGQKREEFDEFVDQKWKLLAFSSDQAHLLALNANGDWIICDLTDVHSDPRLIGKVDRDSTAAISHDARVLAVSKTKPDHGWNVISLDSVGLPAWGYRWSNTYTEFQTGEDVVRTIAVSRDGKSIAAANAKDDLDSHPSINLVFTDLLGFRIQLVGHSTWINHVVFSPDGNTLASSTDHGEIIVWKVPHNASDAYSGALTRRVIDVRSIGSCEGISLSDDGKARVMIDRANSIGYRTEKGFIMLPNLGATLEQIRPVGSGKPVGFALNATMNVLAIESVDGRIWLWDLLKDHAIRLIKSAIFLKPPAIALAEPMPIAYSADGRYLAVAGSKGKVAIWSLLRPMSPHIFEIAQGDIIGLAFTPNGSALAVSSDSQNQRSTVSIIETTMGKLLGTIPFEHPVMGLALANDRTTLATTSVGKIIFWDVVTMKQIGTAFGFAEDSRTMLTFSQNGKQLLCGGRTDPITLWTTDPHDWQKLARKIANRRLNPQDAVAVPALQIQLEQSVTKRSQTSGEPALRQTVRAAMER